VTTNPYPAGDELTFLRGYEETTLRRIEVVSDALLEHTFRADDSHRAALAAGILAELAEAARRLLAVCTALRDRRVPVARALLRPLPTADDWHPFAEAMYEADPADLVRAMGLDDRARESAAELASVRDLARHAEVIRVHESGAPITVIEPGEPPSLLLIGHDHAAERAELRIPLTEARVIALADATGHLVALARDFLLTHIELREESLARHGEAARER
jgi:hypothetical protein